MVSVLRPGQRHINIPGIGVQTSRRAVASGALPCYYLSFDGTDYGTLSLAFTPPVTFVGWLKPTSTAQQVIFSESGYSYSWQKWTVNYCGHGGTSYGGTVQANQWQHFAVTIPANGSQIRVFLNGVDVSAVVGNSNGATATYTRLGGRFDGALMYTGLVSAIGAASGVLSVATMYAAGTFHKPLDTATFNLLALNMRNEMGAGTIVDDESPNNKNVTLAASPNTPTWSGTMATGGPTGWSDT